MYHITIKLKHIAIHTNEKIDGMPAQNTTKILLCL